MDTVLVRFRDLTDKHLYNEGDPFPWDGRAIDDQRLAALRSNQNTAGRPLIESVGDPVTPVAEAPESPAKPAARTARKSRKTA